MPRKYQKEQPLILDLIDFLLNMCKSLYGCILE